MANVIPGILLGGISCAILDGAASTIQFALRGVNPSRVWQGVASGLLGPDSFRHGTASAVLGLLCHFLIAMVAATVFSLAIRYLPSLVRHSLLTGALYGVIVFLFMNLVVIPLSAMPKRPFTWSGVITQVLIHIFCVGLPISLAASRFWRQ
jgi:hypothetical protein